MAGSAWVAVLTKLSKLARLGRLNAKEFKAAADAIGKTPSGLKNNILAATRLSGLEAQLARDIVSTVGEAALETLAIEAAEIVGAATAGWLASTLGISLSTVIIGAIVIGLVAGGIYIYSQSGTHSGNVGDTPVPCPTQVPRLQKCPWTPDGYSIGSCAPGWCWDGGPQGALACKQEQSVPNSGRTYTSDLVCNEGFSPERDPCTNVITKCVPIS